MSDQLLPALSLRCRSAEWVDRPEALVEFERRPAPLPPYRRDLALAELLIADQAARAWAGIEAGERPVLSCETARFRVSEAFARSQAERPAVEDWSSQGKLVADLLAGSKAGPGRRAEPSTLRRSLVALAVTIPMLATSLAEAAPPQVAMSGLRVEGPPKLPSDPTPAPVEGPTPTTAPEPTTAPAITTAAPVVEAPPAPVVVAPRTASSDDSLSLTGSNLWDGLMDKPLLLTLKDGTELAGKVVAQSSRELAFARASDGTVVAVPKSDVAGIRLRPTATTTNSLAANGRVETGAGMLAGGGVMTGVGAAATLSGAVMLGIYPSGIYISLPLLLPGLATLAGGVILLVKGRQAKTKYNAMLSGQVGKVRLTPTVAASRQGGQAGLVLRF